MKYLILFNSAQTFPPNICQMHSYNGSLKKEQNETKKKKKTEKQKKKKKKKKQKKK